MHDCTFLTEKNSTEKDRKRKKRKNLLRQHSNHTATLVFFHFFFKNQINKTDLGSDDCVADWLWRNSYHCDPNPVNISKMANFGSNSW